MPDARTIRRRVLLRLLGSPWVTGPFVVGMTALTAVWALGLRTGVGVFAGLAGLLAAGGMFLTQLVLRGDKVARQVTEDVIQAEGEARQRVLDNLDRQLTDEDKDPRPETALRDLRALRRAFEEAEAAAGPVMLATMVEVRASVDQLVEQCVRSLGQTATLWQTARQLNSAAARQPLLDQRERVLQDVQATVRQLSSTLVGLQTLGTGEASPRELARLREELDRSLEVARTVEERVASLLEATPSSRVEMVTPETKG